MASPEMSKNRQTQEGQSCERSTHESQGHESQDHLLAMQPLQQVSLAADESALVAGYVLDDLAAEEREALEFLLVERRDLALEIERMRSAFSLIALESEATVLDNANPWPKPTNALRDRILQQVHLNSCPAPPAIATPHPPLPTPVPLPPTWGALALGGAIATALLGVLGWQNLQLRQELALTRSQVKIAEAQFQSATQKLVKADLIIQTLRQPENRFFVLQGTERAVQATGSLLMNDRQQLMVIHNLPPLPREQVYRLWARVSREAVAYCGQFYSDASGMAQWSIPNPRCGSNPLQMFVTVNASTDPTTQSGLVMMQSRR